MNLDKNKSKNDSLKQTNKSQMVNANIKKTTISSGKTKKDIGNVINFSSAHEKFILTENEINSLFLGFVNLIKKSVVFEKEKKYKMQINGFENQINSLTVELSNKTQELNMLKDKMLNK